VLADSPCAVTLRADPSKNSNTRKKRRALDINRKNGGTIPFTILLKSSTALTSVTPAF